VNLAATWWMTGLIWLVQVVHYPLFEKVGTAEFTAYHHFHTRMITFVVLPPMLLELVCSAILSWDCPRGASKRLAWLGLGCVLLVWGITWFFSIPEHERLAQNRDYKAYQRLVETNWIRVIAWTIHACILLVMTHGVLVKSIGVESSSKQVRQSDRTESGEWRSSGS
jgi:uncharacterized membrane protein